MPFLFSVQLSLQMGMFVQDGLLGVTEAEDTESMDGKIMCQPPWSAFAGTVSVNPYKPPMSKVLWLFPILQIGRAHV